MNCKKGDLAVVIHGEKSAGRIVKVLEQCRAGDEFVSECGRKFIMGDGIPGHTWHIEGFVYIANIRAWCPIANDEDLRPIRPNDGEDETLAWAGKPEQVVL